MAVSIRFSLLCILLALSTVAGISAANSAPSPGADCASLVGNMVDCLSFVTADGTANKPEGTCCSGLKTVLKTDADCLCEAFKNSAQLGVTLNVTKALTLPSACHVSAPSIGNCAPLSPLAVSPSSIAGAPIGANEGAPAPTLGGSGSSGVTPSVELFVLTVVAATLFASF